MILITGGLGYIGSHFAVSCLNQNHDVVILDNLSNSSIQVVDQIQSISGKRVAFEKGDVLDTNFLNSVFLKYKINTVVHFAGLKAVAESVEKPCLYYKNNVQGSLNLVEVMHAHGVTNFIFSSSATVYGEPKYLPYDEQHPKNPVNPYGRSKSMVEDLLKDHCHAQSNFTAVSLRYFNPVGAHPTGLIGEEPNGIPNNLMPFIVKVASKSLSSLTVFGSDYDTKDGTGERDYIHVMDLAEGHRLAMQFMQNNKGFHAFNLGSGTPVSVLEMIHAFESNNQVKVPYKLGNRRPGDLPAFWANPELANKSLGFKTTLTLEHMVKDSWNYLVQSKKHHEHD